MNLTTPTTDELCSAYKLSDLRRIGVSLQKALDTPATRIALKLTAIAMRNRQAVNSKDKS